VDAALTARRARSSSANSCCSEQQAPALLALPGCESVGVECFDSDAKLASHAGAAPVDASSGRQPRHRLNRSGNRQLN